MFHPVDPDRHWVAVSLAEAATVRRVLHIGNNSERNNGGGGQNEEKNGAFNVLKGANIALRYSPLATPGAETKGDGGLLFDVGVIKSKVAELSPGFQIHGPDRYISKANAEELIPT